MRIPHLPKALATVSLLAIAATPQNHAKAAAPSGATGIHLLDNHRTGYRPEPLQVPLHRAWTYAARHRPRPAWPEPAWETQRIDFDYAFPIASDRGLVFVASSANHTVRALDLDTGAEKWRFFTQGPVRLAPAIHGSNILFSSDDGFAYCLEAATGRLVWKYRPRIPDERLMGNDQLISRWPGRSGVIVEGDRAYTSFGIWSPEGIVVACLDASTGKPIWLNDSAGTRYMTQPHFEAMGGISPNGYMALCGDVLVVPCGRATPAFFDSRTGELLWHESEGLFPGGAWTMAFGDLAFTPCEMLKKPNPVAPIGPEAKISDEASLVAIRARDGEEVFHLHGALHGVIDADGLMTLIGPKGLLRVALDDVLKAAPGSYEPKRGTSEGHFVEAEDHMRWLTPSEHTFALLQAGSTLVAGGRQNVSCYDATDGKKIWDAPLEGDARELLLVGERLLVSTTEGEIHCFQPKRNDAPGQSLSAAAAAAISQTAAAAGFGLMLGKADASHLADLAKQTALTWHWAAPIGDHAAMRGELDDAGLYGTRVVIQEIAPGPLPYADYLANLILVDIRGTEQLDALPASEVYRVLRPCGGVALISSSNAMRDSVRQWLGSADIPDAEIVVRETGARIQRGPLPGAGAWTHQYADPGKSAASEDRRVRLPLKTLWFGGVGPSDVVSRHYRTPAPLAIDGHLYVPGNQSVTAIDAYNGRMLWKRDLPDLAHWPAAHRGNCLAADTKAVYALQATTCLQLDANTGKTLQTYKGPDLTPPADAPKGESLIWEYLAVTDESVVGTLGYPNIQLSWWSRAYPANHVIFALDKKTGATRWQYLPKSPIDSSAIAIQGDTLFLIDGLPQFEVLAGAEKSKGKAKSKAQPKSLYRSPPNQSSRALIALDLGTGAERWRTTEIGEGQNSLWVKSDVLLATLTPDGAMRASNSSRMRTKGPAVSAFDAKNGAPLWNIDKPGRLSPVIIGDTLYLPDAYELRSGKPIERANPFNQEPATFSPACGQGCGKYAGCPGALMMRSGSFGFYDLRQNSGTYHFPNMRASCWINLIPACGLVLAPEGSSSCPCAYNYKTSIALVPTERHNHWGLYGGTPLETDATIRELRLNFGAPGDKADEKGNIWLAFPRPNTRGPRGAGGMGRVSFLDLPVELEGDSDRIRPITRNPDWTTIENTDTPWLYSCALAGPVHLRAPLGQTSSKPRPYQITLFFCQLEGVGQPAPFDVQIQGLTVLKNFDLFAEVGAPNRPVIKEFTVEASDAVSLRLSPLGDGPPPLISAMQILAK